MGIEIPGWLRTAADWIAGDWPEADETAMRRMADAWDTAATETDELITNGDAALKKTLTTVDSAVNAAMTGKWAEMDTALKELKAISDQASELLENTATDIERAKLLIIAQLVAFAVQLALATASLVVTFGTSSAAAAAAGVVGRQAVVLIIKQMLLKIGKQAALGALEGGATSFATEFVKQSFAGEGLNAGDLWKETRRGMVNGAVEGIAGGKGSKDVSVNGNTTLDGRDVPPPPSRTPDAPNGDRTPDAPNGDRTPDAPNGDRTPDAPNGDRTPDAPNGDQSPETPDGENPAPPTPPTPEEIFVKKIDNIEKISSGVSTAADVGGKVVDFTKSKEDELSVPKMDLPDLSW